MYLIIKSQEDVALPWNEDGGAEVRSASWLVHDRAPQAQQVLMLKGRGEAALSFSSLHPLVSPVTSAFNISWQSHTAAKRQA